MSGTMHWWGRWPAPTKGYRAWQVGPWLLRIQRHDRALRAGWARRGDPAEPRCAVAELLDEEAALDPSDRYTWARVVAATDEPEVEILPRTADRPMVIRPIERTVVVPGGQTQLYVSTPLWASVSAAGTSTPLVDVACWRPSDTWFGSQVAGTLCYASRTRGTRHLEHVQHLPHRAVTVVSVRNEDSVNLALERVKLPVGRLSLFEDDDENLWTEGIELVQRGGEADQRVTISEPPPGARDRRVAGPRLPRTEGLMERVFSGLLPW